MKILILALLLSSSAFAGLTCVTPQKVRGWTGVETFDYISISALAFQSDELLMANLQGAFQAGEDLVKRDSNYRPKNPRYRNFDRYLLADAWHTFMILLPRDFKSLSFYNRFDGYIQVINDDSPGAQVYQLKCGLR